MNNFNAIKCEWEGRFVSEEICKIYAGSLFHYTTRENLWNIIESNSFYARNLRFSNDSAEYIIGKEEIEKYLKGDKLSDLDDCYMVCFCKKDNILSQWREYARGGVSMEMNFQEDSVYTIMCNARTEKINREERREKEKSPYLIPKGYFSDCHKKYNVVYARPIEVKYIEPGIDELKEAVEKIQRENEGQEINCLKQLLPFIKHKGFEEEKEVRLVFFLINENAPKIVDYLNIGGQMKPYIRVQVGDAQEAEYEKCIVKYSDIPNELKTAIESQFMDGYLEVKDYEGNNQRIEMCLEKENVNRTENESGHIFIGNSKYQEYIFQMFDHYVMSHNAENKTNIQIWCDGFLPIRGITVGPSADAKELCESITHKIRNIYWLKYATVKVSDIPYRS